MPSGIAAMSTMAQRREVGRSWSRHTDLTEVKRNERIVGGCEGNKTEETMQGNDSKPSFPLSKSSHLKQLTTVLRYTD